MNYYAGIGSRETPNKVCHAMTVLAKHMAKQRYVLRSGGARGADTAFEEGAGRLKEIFTSRDATPDAILLASQHHPNWGACNDYARKLHGRNAMIVLGRDLKTPIVGLYCWTPGGLIIGGTGLALRIAKAHGILTINLATGDFADSNTETWRASDWPIEESGGTIPVFKAKEL